MSELIVRADAGIQVGTGHVMRCLALAQEWIANSGKVRFMGAGLSLGLRNRLESEGCTVVEIESEGADIDFLRHVSKSTALYCPWVLLDGYHFTPSLQQSIVNLGVRLAVVDDFGHVNPTCADMVINANPCALRDDYVLDRADADVLLGSRYALLRREFTRKKHIRRFETDETRILVTFGGSDPSNVTARVLDACSELDNNLKFKVLVGSLNPHRNELAASIKSLGNKANMLEPVSDMSDLMAWADMAIAAGGHTCWELAAMGLPALVIEIADNQSRIAAALAQAGTVITLGPEKLLQHDSLVAALRDLVSSPAKRCQMSVNAMSMVDGFGCRRIVQKMKKKQIAFRRAVESDAQWIWELSNDAVVRRASFNTGLIPWDDHLLWLRRKLADPACTLLVVESDVGVRVAQCRFENNGDAAKISVSLHECIRGSGWGAAIISAACAWYSGNIDECRPVVAEIREQNSASLRAFNRAGFVITKRIFVSGSPALEMELKEVSQ